MHCGLKINCAGDANKVAWINQVCGNKKTQLEILKTKYKIMQKEWDKQQEHLGRLQGEVFKLRNELKTRSSFCAALGATLGNLLWKASRLQPVIELLLNTNQLPELFNVVCGTIVSFMSTYTRSMPEIQCDETQFVLSMCGIVANIAAVPEGRQYIVGEKNGKDLIDLLLRTLPNVPNISGDPLKRVMLMIIYNLSINQTGLQMIQEDKNLLTTLSQLITSNRSPALKLLALKILESITFDIPSGKVLLRIKQYLNKEKIEPLTETSDAEIRQYANSILENLKKAELAMGHVKVDEKHVYVEKTDPNCIM